MNLFSQKIKVLGFSLIGFLSLQNFLIAQIIEEVSNNSLNEIKLFSDTSGYLDFSEDDININEVIPTIKGELNVNEQGVLTYTVPIEVYKGINDFQPNLALSYNSQTGNGQAGMGWNLAGISAITIGGKIDKIDGINEGVQYDGTDPYYLDGQRLIQIGTSNQYVTEQYSHIKITKTDSNTFRIQYTDGKIAIYKFKALGQYLIDNIQDAYGNKIFYIYEVSQNTPYLSKIKYGGTTQSNSPFTISFTYNLRTVPSKIFRNGIEINNNKYLKEIVVSSTSMGIHRKYILTHDLTSTKIERLRKVDVENGSNEKLKPLIFNYNVEGGTININKSTSIASSFKDNTKFLGSVTYGDFTGDGQITATYLVNSSKEYYKPLNVGEYTLINSNYGSFEVGIDPYFNTRKLSSGRILMKNGMYSPYDILLQTSINDVNFGFIPLNGGYILNRKYLLEGIDIKNPENKSQAFFRLAMGYEVSNTDNGRRVVDAPYFEINSDFNNDGLVDKIIFAPPSYISKGYGKDHLNTPLAPNDEDILFINQKTSPKVYFLEVGKNLNSAEELHPITTTGIDFDKNSEAYIVEFNGDNIPEILLLNRTTKKFSIFKIKNKQLVPLLENQSLSNFDEDTPLIFGDYNGDGLTDFITPQKTYSIENSSIDEIANKINTEQHKWWQYISTGIGFVKKERNFTSQKLAFCKPSQRTIVEKSTFWQKLWNGIPDMYSHTEYTACGTLPIDYNNDGKTDLVSFTKFGKVQYKELLNESWVIGGIVPNGNPSFANKFRFFENTYNSTNTFDLTFNTQNQISIEDDKISPLSLIVNNSEYRGVEGQKVGVKFIDPIHRKEWRIDIESNEFLENQLQEINNNSGVNQKVEYTPLSTIVRNGNHVSAGIYYKASIDGLGLNYPYFVNKHQPFYLLVKRVNTIFDNHSISKEYRYENAIQDFNGKGFIGFQQTKVSDPYESKYYKGEYLPKNPFEGVMWSINTYDPLFENALSKTTYGSLDGEHLLTSTTNTYETINKSNHQYTIQNKSSVSEDFLKGITISKSYTYRTSDLLLQQAVTNYNNESISTAIFEYKPSFYSGDHFHFGKINAHQVSITKGQETFTTKDEYTFNTNGSLKEHKKYGHNTDPLITEYTYFTNGNIKSERISASGFSPLTTTYAYEESNRYVNKITSPDEQISEFEINTLGQILSETSSLGLTNQYEYDNWGNKNKITDYLGIETTLIKEQLNDGKYSLSTETPNVPKSIVIFDRFDRQIQSKTQSINNKWIVSDIVYDVFGKKIKESEPYFEGSTPSQWNKFEYDNLDRVVEQTLYNGKVITTCYEGMTVTVEDGEQKTSKTLDAMGNVIKHTDMGGEVLYDYYPNGTLKTANYDGIVISVEQDGWGNKTKLNDPSAGIYTYEYDVFGKLLLENTPKGQTVYTYDNFGKLLTETSTGDETNITSSYIYDPTTKLPTKITGTTGNGEHSFVYETFYDQYYRINGKKETHDAFIYQTSSEFDGLGRVKNTTLTTTVNHINKTTSSKVENIYESGSGILVEQKDVLNNRRIWKIDEVNQKGQTTQLNYGNGFVLENTYNNLFLPTKIKHKNNATNQTALDINYNFDPIKNRLNARNLLVFGKNEQFQYDDLDRLIKEAINNEVINEYTYDVRGRMTYNTQVGTYEYGDTNYHINKFKLNENGQNLLDNRGFHQLKFNAFKQVTEIYLPEHDRINYDFNLFKNRSIAYYGSEDEDKNDRPIRKYYTSDNAVEIIFDNSNNQTQITTYVDGDPYGSSYIKVEKYTGTALNSSQHYYLHRDYQGSILGISNTNGHAVEQRYFDAWGNIKQVKHITWNGSTSSTVTDTALGIIDRGYTGHEHLQSVGLIHMNGRLYDPVIRRFLSPDNFVQDPYNTQNFDRYGYVYNNPLMYSDPSGEYIISGIAIIGVSVILNGINNMTNGIPFWYGMGKTATIAAASAIISFGIGTATNIISNAIAKAAVQSAAHGMTGGIMSSIDGGDFGSGFAAGAVSSLVSSGIQISGISDGQLNKFGQSDWYNAATIAAGGLSGGISSTIAGGNFWAGARQGLITSGLNHVAHQISSPTKNNNATQNNSYEDGDPPYKYNRKTYESKGELYGAIFIDQAAEQFGIKDIVALAAALDGTFPSIDKVGALGSGNKTSYASKYGSELFPQKMGTKLPTHIKNGSLRYTKVLGRFLGRIAGPIGWGILTYDVGMTLYNTHTIYNSIINGK